MAGISGFKCQCFRPPSSSLSYSSTPFLPTPQLRIPRRLSTFPRIYAITSNDIKVGLNIEVDGNPWKVIEFLHVKPGKGAAFVRTTLRNYVTGNQCEKTFRAGSKIEEADISKETKQYTYKDGAQYVFMDLNSYEESRLNEADVGDKAKWLKEGMDCTLLFWNGKVIDFELPINVKLAVTEVDPGLKGDTAQGGSKPAIVETGAVVNVPLFVNAGDTILIDTRTGQYMSRA
ncbi:elongation factor P family protein [Perilla frutescens var. hirtella]|uniref:Elongation factor P family protein n=1 Tax=Perilla frutescens var. hirtella TaxID=608512 RepID=A0AAD4JEL4_PERFH|nr:elongation factor P family protein [Perilla frutescens var. hirtella]